MPQPLAPFSYGNAMNQAQQTTNLRSRNALMEQQYDQGGLNALTRGGIDPTAPMRNYAERERLIASGASPKELAIFDNYVRAMNIKNLGGVQTIVAPGGRGNTPLSTLEREVDAAGTLAGTKRYAGTAGQQAAKAGQPDPYAPVTQGEISIPPQSAAPVSEATLAAEKATAVKKAEFEQKKENLRPKREGAADAAQDRTKSLKELVKQAKQQAGTFTTGWFGAKTKDIPGTPAHDLSQTLLTLQANAGFDRLQEMRDNSVTGGALGQVSERELGLLMAAYAALEQSQSKGQFMQNLDRFEKQVDQSWKRVKLAYRLDYGEDYKEKVEPEQKPNVIKWDDM